MGMGRLMMYMNENNTAKVIGFVNIPTNYNNIETIMDDLCDEISDLDCGNDLYEINGSPISLDNGVLLLMVTGYVDCPISEKYDTKEDKEVYMNQYIENADFGVLKNIDWEF